MTEHVLAYDRSIVPQEKYWDCGPASAQVVLNGRGVIVSEDDLIDRIGTTVNGTDYVGLVENALNRLLPDAHYTSVYLENDPPTQEQLDTLWANLVRSIDAGYGLVLNWDAPPSNHPVGVKGSQSPDYGSGEIFHYVPAMGYDDAGERAVWIADPGFDPFGYWVSFDQCARLIPPKGYTYANTAPAPATPPPASPPDNTGTAAPADTAVGPLFGVDLSNNNWGSRSPAAIVPILNQIVAEGFSWIEHKVAEGDYYSDPFWPTVWQWHIDTGFPVVGYHYVTTDPADEQARRYLANDPSNGRAPCMLDFEANSGGIDNFWAVYSAFKAAGINVRLTYLPRWYWSQISSPDLSNVPGLVSSAYEHGNDYASVEYAQSGGADGAGWQPYGGATPVIWQFTDAAIVAGMSMDANAFEGSLAGLNALLGYAPTNPLGGLLMSLSDQQQADAYNAIMGTAAAAAAILQIVTDNQTQLRGPDRKGWPQDGQTADGQNLTVVDALSVTEPNQNSIGAYVAAIKAAVEKLAAPAEPR